MKMFLKTSEYQCFVEECELTEYATIYGYHTPRKEVLIITIDLPYKDKKDQIIMNVMNIIRAIPENKGGYHIIIKYEDLSKYTN